VPNSPERNYPLLHSFTNVVEEILTDVIKHPPAEAQELSEKMAADVIYETAYALKVPVDEPSEHNLAHAYQVLENLSQMPIPNERIATELAVAAHSLMKAWLDAMSSAILNEEDKLQIMKIISAAIAKEDAPHE
jgi:hypothetical protein